MSNRVDFGEAPKKAHCERCESDEDRRDGWILSEDEALCGLIRSFWVRSPVEAPKQVKKILNFKLRNNYPNMEEFEFDYCLTFGRDLPDLVCGHRSGLVITKPQTGDLEADKEDLISEIEKIIEENPLQEVVGSVEAFLYMTYGTASWEEIPKDGSVHGIGARELSPEAKTVLNLLKSATNLDS